MCLATEIHGSVAVADDVILLGELNPTWMFCAVANLMASSVQFRNWPVGVVAKAVGPPLALRQYFAFSDGQRLTGFVSWAHMSEEWEREYLRWERHVGPEAWASGDRIWVMDGIIPFGNVLPTMRIVRRELARLASENDWVKRWSWVRCYGQKHIVREGGLSLA